MAGARRALAGRATVRDVSSSLFGMILCSRAIVGILARNEPAVDDSCNDEQHPKLHQ